MTLDTVPIPAEMPGVTAVVAGGCITSGKRFRRWAHAHNIKGRPNYGAICFLGRSRIYMADGRPSRVFWHEYAHILTPNHGHDDAWRATMKRLGQPIPARYRGKR